MSSKSLTSVKVSLYVEYNYVMQYILLASYQGHSQFFKNWEWPWYEANILWHTCTWRCTFGVKRNL